MSALPFTPTDTSIYRSFHDCLEYPSLLVGFQRTWSPMGRELAGHTGEVVSVAVSSDGMRVVSASYDKTIRVWDAIVGAEISEMRGHESLHSIGCVGISPDGRWVVSGSGDATVRVWDAISGAHVAEMRGHHAKVLSVHLSPDGHRVASGSCDNTVRVWNTATGSQVLPTITGHTDWVGTVAFSADGKMIVSGSNDGTIRVWNAISGAEVQPAPRGYIDWVSQESSLAQWTKPFESGIGQLVPRCWPCKGIGEM
jgi:WD40 repeat protein